MFGGGFFATHLECENFGKAFPVVSLPPNDLVPIRTPTYLCRQYGLDEFWKWFLYIAVRRITGYMCNKLNQQEKNMLKNYVWNYCFFKVNGKSHICLGIKVRFFPVSYNAYSGGGAVVVHIFSTL